MSAQFQRFLSIKGILHQLSYLYAPEQNGLAKRKNRHVIETTITLLQTASLPSQFWYHACAIATYLINRMPTSILGMKSPFEVLYHSPPRLDHLKVFGYLCYPFVKPYRSDKLEQKTMDCIFLGYATNYKGYICYSMHNKKFIVSRHVLFDETQFAAKSHTSSPVSKSSSFQFSGLSSTPVAHNNTFQHFSVILIPLPHVFVLSPNANVQTNPSSFPLNNCDPVST